MEEIEERFFDAKSRELLRQKLDYGKRKGSELFEVNQLNLRRTTTFGKGGGYKRRLSKMTNFQQMRHDSQVQDFMTSLGRISRSETKAILEVTLENLPDILCELE